MASGHYFIPVKDGEFEAWLKNLIAYILKMVIGANPKWTHIPTTEAEKLAAFYEEWRLAWEAAQKPHTPAETAAKNDARAAAEKAVQSFKRRFLDDPPVTNADRVAMELPLFGNPRTPDHKPETIPEAETDISVIRKLIFRFKDKGAKSRAKPHGVHGAEFRWNIQDTPPVHIETELIHSDFDTASPFTLVFEEAVRGKRVYYALRWESITNLKGEWSEVYSAVIP
jgi:hypothetical protein